MVITLILDVKTEYLDEENELPLPLIWFGPKILDKSSSISSSDLLKQQQDKKDAFGITWWSFLHFDVSYRRGFEH